MPVVGGKGGEGNEISTQVTSTTIPCVPREPGDRLGYRAQQQAMPSAISAFTKQSGRHYTKSGAGWAIIQSHMALKILLHSLEASGRKRTRLTDPDKNPKLTDTLVTSLLRNCPHGLIPQHTDEQREAKNREVWCSGATACSKGKTQVQAFPAQSPCPSPSLPCSGLIYKLTSFPRSFTLSYWIFTVLTEAGGSCVYPSASKETRAQGFSPSTIEPNLFSLQDHNGSRFSLTPICLP